MVLLGIVFSMLILPKILAGLTMMGRASAGFGGRGRIWLSILLEHIYTALIAPVLMLVHSTFIIDVLLGRDSGWGKQNRGDAETSWAEAWQRHRWHVLFGLLVAAIGYGYAPSLVWWLSPVVIGLILSPFMSVWSSRVSVGQWLARRRLLATPEELSPPREWTEARTAEATLLAQLPASTGPLGMLEFVLNDPMLNALHMALLPENSETLANPDDLARAQGKLAAAVTNLSSGEKTALLYHSPTLIRLGHTA
jgi:membrane glycosyltransferase